MLTDSKKATAAFRVSGGELQSRAAAIARATLLAVLLLSSIAGTQRLSKSKEGFWD